LPHAISHVASRPTVSRKPLTESYLRGWAGRQGNGGPIPWGFESPLPHHSTRPCGPRSWQALQGAASSGALSERSESKGSLPSQSLPERSDDDIVVCCGTSTFFAAPTRACTSGIPTTQRRASERMTLEPPRAIPRSAGHSKSSTSSRATPWKKQ